MDYTSIIIDSKSEEILRKIKKEPSIDWKSELKQYILYHGLDNKFEEIILEKVSYQILHNIEKG